LRGITGEAFVSPALDMAASTVTTASMAVQFANVRGIPPAPPLIILTLSARCFLLSLRIVAPGS